jgi:hypothetical protein
LSSSFFDSSGESKLLDGEPPHIVVGTELEGDRLDHLLVPEKDCEHSFLLGDNCLGGQHGFECIVSISIVWNGDL